MLMIYYDTSFMCAAHMQDSFYYGWGQALKREKLKVSANTLRQTVYAQFNAISWRNENWFSDSMCNLLKTTPFDLMLQNPEKEKVSSNLKYLTLFNRNGFSFFISERNETKINSCTSKEMWLRMGCISDSCQLVFKRDDFAKNTAKCSCSYTPQLLLLTRWTRSSLCHLWKRAGERAHRQPPPPSINNPGE